MILEQFPETRRTASMLYEPPGLEITEGTTPDVAAVADASLLAAEEVNLGETSYARLCEAIRRYISRRDCLWLVARLDGEAVGSIAVRIDEMAFIDRTLAIVDAVGVIPRCRGMKIAQSLLQRAETWARMRHADGFVLTVPPGSPFAEGLERQGYQEMETWWRKDLKGE